MTTEIDSVFEVIECLRRKSPEYLDVITAKTDEEFESAFDAMIDGCVRRLESNAKNLYSLNEEGLSAVLATAISVPGLSALQEANSNGHVDITIEAQHCVPARVKLAEAKIWNGPTYHINGIKQLLDRYTTGREGRGLLISYVRQPGIKQLMSNLRARMDEERPCRQVAPTTPHALKWSFLSTHGHASGEKLEVGHIGCNLHWQPPPPT